MPKNSNDQVYCSHAFVFVTVGLVLCGRCDILLDKKEKKWTIRKIGRKGKNTKGKEEKEMKK